MTKRLQSIIIGFFLLTTGCAMGISPQTHSLITYHGPFVALQADTDSHVGQIVLLGGQILESEASSDQSEIEVLQSPLTPGDRPDNIDRSQGRFLIQSKHFLDPAIYQRNLPITVVGRIIGSEFRTIGDLNYEYPLVEPIEIKLWQEPQWVYPNVFFSLGVGGSF